MNKKQSTTLNPNSTQKQIFLKDKKQASVLHTPYKQVSSQNSYVASRNVSNDKGLLNPFTSLRSKNTFNTDLLRPTLTISSHKGERTPLKSLKPVQQIYQYSQKSTSLRARSSSKDAKKMSDSIKKKVDQAFSRITKKCDSQKSKKYVYRKCSATNHHNNT